MRTHRSYWHAWIGMLGLMIVLAACGGGSTNSTTGTNGAGTPQATSTPSSSGPAAPFTSKVSFTASGGLTGSYTISTEGAGGSIGSNSSGKVLQILILNQSWRFVLNYIPYTGSGSYTIKPISGNITQDIEFGPASGLESWGTFSNASSPCQLIIASDTSVGPNDHEIKGSFSCPSLAVDSYGGGNKPAPITLSNGQFAITAAEQ